eukprot:CAMPEP_0194161454 /NCGR_PEP_ID=MMETSP0152-20130528/78944_1 /TAXON_ID=1049557 /ORGANISM="Thalassiothrix antarctica, Strain L6-D1" /LENGTH=1489 /DNA_ID=CAMNT_0038871245 /DNA_START=953 /DNA_END=5423 /DNA_ORIENTATION=+
MNEDFTTVQHMWSGGYGALSHVTNDHTFKVYGRKIARDHGPTWDMEKIRNCLIPGQTYLFRCNVKFTKAEKKVGDLTSCAINGSNCLTLYSTIKTPNGQIGRRKGFWGKNHGIRYGDWNGFYATFEYNQKELNQMNIFQLLQLRGPEGGVDIEIDDVLFSLPDPKTLPNSSNTCNGNLIFNGNAEMDPIHPFPMLVSGGVLQVADDGVNQYFRHTARTSSSYSFFYEFPVLGCLSENAKYKISLDLRTDSKVPFTVRLKLRSQSFDDTSIWWTIVDCDGINEQWSTCSVQFNFPSGLLGSNKEFVRLHLESIGNPTANMDIDNMSMELLNGSITSIVVPEAGVLNCWGKGADILITSHTLDYRDSQVRTLVADPIPDKYGHVMLQLDNAIVPPTTRQQSKDFAVEVALLSRNILFQGEKDPANDLFGAHFMVMKTPYVEQMIDGIEFQNFGQQGVLGRYPIHLHLCEDVTGTVIKRNCIRYSNQRCIVIHGSNGKKLHPIFESKMIVIHGSNGATIVENIAYETHGHCFMLEDGGEINNTFRRNLGAKTLAAKRAISPEETDHTFPSTFWCSNPQNSWISNVAAGSKDNGFWFELRKSVRGPTASFPLSRNMNPRTMQLKIFHDNVSHSNGKHGIRTYPDGYLPTKEAVFSNNRSYRNVQEGFFIHNSRRIVIRSGLVADNRYQIDLDMVDDIKIEETSIIGVSDSFEAIMESQSGILSHGELIIGIDLHGYPKPSIEGITIHNVSFTGFDDPNIKNLLIRVDNEAKTGFFSTISNIQSDQSLTPDKFEFLSSEDSGILEDLYIIDLDSSMRPIGSTTTGVSAVVSNSPMMTAFLPQNSCDFFPMNGYAYCSDACLRSVTFAVDPADTEDVLLRITNENETYIDLPGIYYNDDSGLFKDTDIRRRRYFIASLPLGSYHAFFHEGNGQIGFWPSHAEVSISKALCNPSLSINNVQVDIPQPLDGTCRELIRNGDAEASSFDPWLQHESGVMLGSGDGLSGSNGIADILQNGNNGALGQFLDIRCLKYGRQYEVQVWVKLAKNGSPISCDDVNNCPKARLRIGRSYKDSNKSSPDLLLDVASSFVRPYKKNSWNMLGGVFTVDKRIENGSSVAFEVARQISGVKMVLDNVSVREIERDCSELIFNGNFSDGTSRFWDKNKRARSISLNMINIDGNWALETVGNPTRLQSPTQSIRVGCMEAGARYFAMAKFKLIKDDGNPAFCDQSFLTGKVACPRMRLRSIVDLGLESQKAQAHDGGSIALTNHGISADGWYAMTGSFSATTFDEQADKSELTWDRLPRNTALMIDSVSIVPLPKNCQEMILNGDIENHETLSFWRTWVNGGFGRLHMDKFNGDEFGIKVFNRTSAGDGLHQFVDPRCIAEAKTLRFSAQMKLIARSTGKTVQCQPNEKSLSKGCPPVRVSCWKGNNKVSDHHYFMTNRPSWSLNGYNRYENEFHVNSAPLVCDRVAIAVRQYNIEWDMILLKVSLQAIL